nr:hypothetical protein [Tanacetum cinerariifolium]
MSSAMPAGRVIDRSASSRIIYVEVSSGKEIFLQIERGIKLMLAPRSARAKNSSNCGKLHRMRNLPGSPNFSGGGETEGPANVTPLRVVIALRSARGLEMVMLGSKPEPEEEAAFIWK